MKGVEKLGYDSFKFETSPGQEYYLTFLPGTVSLHGAGHFQYFRNEEDLRPKDLVRLFPNQATVCERAELHKDGTVNKDKFIAAVQVNKKLASQQRTQLLKFIGDCDCTPPVVRTKLRAMGFGPYTDELVFEDMNPALQVSCGLVAHLLVALGGASLE